MANRQSMDLERGSWSWGISFILSRSARPNVRQLSHLLHCTRLLPRAMLPRRWAYPGKLAASLVKTLLSSPMGRCGVLLTRPWSRMSNAEKPTEACASCMEPASAGVVPVRCASSASGKALPQQSHARSASCCILSRLALPRCGYARLEPQNAPARLYAARAIPTHRSEPGTSRHRSITPSGCDPVPCAARALASLVGRAACSQRARSNRKPSDDQVVRRSRSLCLLARLSNGFTSS